MLSQMKSTLEHPTVIFQRQHGQKIALFQILMAKQTEDLDMDLKMVLNAVNYLSDHQELGFYLVKIKDEVPFGSLLLTFENSQSWWIQSVYVEKQFRRQGHFKQLFREASLIAKQRGAHSLKLYAVDENLKAIAVYESLGMHINGERFYTYDFVYGKVKLEELKAEEQKSEIRAKKLENISSQKLETFEDLLKKKEKSKNNKVGIYRKQQLIGIANYFTEYSQWRFGLIYYIDSLLLDKSLTKEEINSVHKQLCCYFSVANQLKIGALRYIFNKESEKVSETLELGEVQHYYVLQMDF